MSLYDNPQLQQAQTDVTNANTDYTNAAATQATLPDMLHKALTDKFTSSSPIIGDLASAQTNFLNTTTSAPLSVMSQNNGGYVWSPNQQADIINKTENAALTPVSFLNMLLGLSTGGIQNVIDSTGRAYGAEVLKKQGAANNAQSAFENLFKILQAKQSENEFNQTNALNLSGGVSGIAAKNALTDAQNGTTLRGLLSKYTGQLSSQDIYGIYNTINYGTNTTGKFQIGKGGWGAATETPDILSQLGIKPPVKQLNAAEQARHDNLQSALASLDANEQNLASTGGAKGAGGFLTNTYLGQFTDPAGYTYQQTKIEVATALAKAITNSSRPAQTVIDKYMHSLPDYADTPQVAAEKLRKLRVELNAQVSSFGYNDLLEANNISTNSGGNITQSDGTVWKQNSDGSYTRIK